MTALNLNSESLRNLQKVSDFSTCLKDLKKVIYTDREGNSANLDSRIRDVQAVIRHVGITDEDIFEFLVDALIDRMEQVVNAEVSQIEDLPILVKLGIVNEIAI